MKRDISALQNKEFDVIVIGAGIHGACVARDATLRGLKVALIDKSDICGATSHNSLKIIHGGIRYLQHLNIKRTVESIKEQRNWLRTAPHLVRPMKCIMPTYGHGLRGPAAMWCGIKAYEFLGMNRNKSIPSYRRIPRGGLISPKNTNELIPSIRTDNLTGAAYWYDAQVFGADEAVMEIVQGAHKSGAKVANYVEAVNLIRDGKSIQGVDAIDRETGATFQIQGKMVVNAAGPWILNVLKSLPKNELEELKLPLTKSMNIVTKRFIGDHALGIQSKLQSDSVVGSTKRLYFFTPWKDCTVVGTTHFPYQGDPDAVDVSEEEVQQFLDEINQVYPAANLNIEDVHYCYKGLTPAEEDNKDKDDGGRSHHSRVIDHESHNIDGLFSVIGVKYTTARLVAEQCVDIICRKFTKKTLSCSTHMVPLSGHDKDNIDPANLDESEFKAFCNSKIRDCMPRHLSDLVLRRMDLAMRGKLTQEQLSTCMDLMAKEYSWDEEKQLDELANLSKVWLSNEINSLIHTHKELLTKSLSVS